MNSDVQSCDAPLVDDRCVLLVQLVRDVVQLIALPRADRTPSVKVERVRNERESLNGQFRGWPNLNLEQVVLDLESFWINGVLVLNDESFVRVS